MAKYIIKAFLIIVISITLITIGLTKYVSLPIIDIQKANAAFSSLRSIMGSAGIVLGDTTAYAFDGTGDYLSVPDHADWDFGTGDFTIETWIYINAYTATHKYVFDLNSGADRVYLAYRNTTLQTAANSLTIESRPSTATWHHVAVVRESSNLYYYLNGVEGGTAAESTDYDAITTFRIGSKNDGDANAFIDGKIDEFRVSNTARYTTAGSPFTVETSEFTSDANTVLLIHCGETKSGTTGSGATFTDSGNTGHTVTEVADAIEDTTTFKF